MTLLKKTKKARNFYFHINHEQISTVQNVGIGKKKKMQKGEKLTGEYKCTSSRYLKS